MLFGHVEDYNKKYKLLVHVDHCGLNFCFLHKPRDTKISLSLTVLPLISRNKF